MDAKEIDNLTNKQNDTRTTENLIRQIFFYYSITIV